MPRNRVEVVRDFPQLAPLSEVELTDYLTAFRAAHARANRLSGCAVAGFGAAVLAILVVVLLVISASILRPLIATSVVLAAIFIAIIVVGVPWFAARLIVREVDRSRLANFNRALLARIMQDPPICIRCGYGLRGVALADDREGVVRCPECALVSPDLTDRVPDAPVAITRQGSTP